MLKTEGVNHVIAQSVNHVSLDMVAAPTGYWAELIHKVATHTIAMTKGAERDWLFENIDGALLPEIGYHIHKKYWRQGFGKEAARAVRDWCFRCTSYHTLYSYMKYTNIGSYSTALANGMKKIKEYPDEKNTVSLVYALTRQEWEAPENAQRQ